MPVQSVVLFSAACLLWAAMAALSAAGDDEVIVTQALVDKVNAAGKGWTATTEPGIRVKGITRKQARAMMGVKKQKGGLQLPPLPKRVFTKEELAKGIPDSFDSATNWPSCPTITHIRDQSACGSCWAVSSAEAMSDRYCTGGVNANLEISAANIMECCYVCGEGCEGGDPGQAWAYWTSTGVLSDSCQPYPFPKCEHHIPVNNYPECPSAAYPTPACASGCNSTSEQPTLYYGASSYALSGVAAFQTEVMTNGPIEVTFDVYEDFLSYKSGVYVQTSQDYLGGHAVRLVGWGTLNGTPYWKIANSWNSDWGLDGYFYIVRGQDECGIEDGGSAGKPQAAKK